MKAKGRRYERELMQRLTLLGVVVRDVAANTGEYAHHECDVIIERAGETLRGEVKWRHEGAGFLRIYQRHEAEGVSCPLMWTKDMAPYWSGTLAQWASWPYSQDCHEVTQKLSSTVTGWLSGRDVVFMRMAHRGWIAVWR